MGRTAIPSAAKSCENVECRLSRDLRPSDFCRVLGGNSYHRLRCPRGRDDYHADEDEHGAQEGPQTERFAAQVVSNKDGHDRIYVSVSSDFGRRFVMD